MPSVKTRNRDEYTETTVSEALAALSQTSGWEVHVDSIESLEGGLTATGLFRPSPHEPCRIALSDWAMPLVTTISSDRLIAAINKGAQTVAEPFDYGYMGPIVIAGRQTTIGLSPVVRSQVQQIVTGFDSKIRERLSHFWNESPGKEQVSASTKSAVQELVAWLCNQSETVSATVSNDGMLSVAAVFPGDVRLYVEIERDGSTLAAVTRERRYARDISGDTIADFTSEVILAAVRSV